MGEALRRKYVWRMVRGTRIRIGVGHERVPVYTDGENVMVPDATGRLVKVDAPQTLLDLKTQDRAAARTEWWFSRMCLGLSNRDRDELVGEALEDLDRARDRGATQLAIARCTASWAIGILVATIRAAARRAFPWAFRGR